MLEVWLLRTWKAAVETSYSAVAAKCTTWWDSCRGGNTPTPTHEILKSLHTDKTGKSTPLTHEILKFLPNKQNTHVDKILRSIHTDKMRYNPHPPPLKQT